MAQSTDNPLITEAVEGYRAYVAEQVAIMQAETTVFTDAVRAGDIEAAKAAYPVSRRSWERIEPIAGLIADIDTAVDAREDDYDGPTDPAFTGWHRLEYQLWTAGDVVRRRPDRRPARRRPADAGRRRPRRSSCRPACSPSAPRS